MIGVFFFWTVLSHFRYSFIKKHFTNNTKSGNGILDIFLEGWRIINFLYMPPIETIKSTENKSRIIFMLYGMSVLIFTFIALFIYLFIENNK